LAVEVNQLKKDFYLIKIIKRSLIIKPLLLFVIYRFEDRIPEEAFHHSPEVYGIRVETPAPY